VGIAGRFEDATAVFRKMWGSADAVEPSTFIFITSKFEFYILIAYAL